jgi:hypothetical protein
VSYPPDEFYLHPWATFHSFNPQVPESGVAGALLLHVDEAARLGGPFRFVLAAGNAIPLDLPAQNVLQMGGAADYRLHAEIRASDIIFRENMFTSEWWDLEER